MTAAAKPYSEWTEADYIAEAERHQERYAREEAAKAALLSACESGDWRAVQGYAIESLMEGAETTIEELESYASGLRDAQEAAEEAADALACLDEYDEHPDEDDVDEAVDAMARFAELFARYDPDGVIL